MGLKSGLLGLFALAAISGTAHANLVNNGSFETGDLTGWTYNNFTGTTPGIGITVLTTGGINTTGYGDNVPNNDGTHAAFFVDDMAEQTLSQSLNLDAGQYSLSFALYATASGAKNAFSFYFYSSLGAISVALLNNSSSTTDVPVGTWTVYSYLIDISSQGSYDLFFEFTSGPTPSKDVLLDNVDLSAVPLPPGLLLLGTGVAGIGYMGRRRARRRAIRAG